MNTGLKKKRFIYNPIVTEKCIENNKSEESNKRSDYSTHVSRPSKKVRLSEEVKGDRHDSKNENVDNLFSDINLNDDDFDFSEAANEIDEIEIAASQYFPTKKHPKIRPSDNELKPTKTTISLKIPKKKPVLPSNSVHTYPSPLQSRPLDQKTSQQSNIKEITFDDKQPTDIKLMDYPSSEKLKLKQVQDELLDYKRKLNDMEKKFYSKDGEIKILRESLRKISEDDRVHKDTIFKLENKLKTQQTEKEVNLLNDVEKLKTQLEFKEREVKSALERQQKLLSLPQLKKPPKLDSPEKNVPGSGFRRTLCSTSSKASTDVKTNFCISKREFLAKGLKKKLKTTLTNATVSKEIVDSIALLAISYKKDKLNITCSHVNDSPTNFCQHNIKFYSNLLSLLQSIEVESYSPTDLVSFICRNLDNLRQLLSSILTIDNNAGFLSENETNASCLLCQKWYEHGIKSFMSLSKASYVFSVVRHYLLLCLTILNNEKVDRLSGQSDQTNMTPHTFTEKDLEYGLQFWKLLRQIEQHSISDLVEEQIFVLFTNLLSLPNDTRCNSLINSIVSDQTISKYLKRPTPVRTVQVIQLFQNSINLNNICGLICSQSDRCPLLIIYNSVISIEFESDCLLHTVFQELISFLSSFIAQHQANALKLVLESNCQCSNEVIECMITVLFDEFKYLEKIVFDTHGTEDITLRCENRLSTFRQGMSLLCILCTSDKALVDKRSAVECNYVYLLVGSMKLYRKIPSVNESEVLMLEDLLDLDQIIDLDDGNIDDAVPIKTDQDI